MRDLADPELSSGDLTTWALATTVYQRARHATAGATHLRADDSDVTTIVLDDRPRPTS
ncbi:hypothetical protein [Streptomyces sp. NBC_01803]|uniref:hypothetical protein n=1 Tax=Streptomyces sp. NBC_01803 TaxID=2975946 RepID=UPI002DDAF88E|nr:hypothetical protein [Streptomyces sp. NBC_01803]WSA42817.1 hypothetical protein OIE51_00500 [Streptomyces sp. NBC_01803]